MIAPDSVVLVGMLFFGNLLKECGVTERLANTARTSMIDIVTILLGFSVGASTQAEAFLSLESLFIFALGVVSFCIATSGGVLFAKFMNLFVKDKINPLIGAAKTRRISCCFTPWGPTWQAFSAPRSPRAYYGRCWLAYEHGAKIGTTGTSIQCRYNVDMGGTGSEKASIPPNRKELK